MTIPLVPPYYNPIRFLNSLDDFTNPLIPQNNQTMGVIRMPYVIEMNEPIKVMLVNYGTFSIPNNSGLKLYLKTEDEEIEIPSFFEVTDNKIVNVIFRYIGDYNCGILIIKNNGTIIKYSNGIIFEDTTKEFTYNSRKEVMITARNKFNRDMYLWQHSDSEYIHINIPCYKVANVKNDVDIENERVRGNNTLRTTISYNDEVEVLEVVSDCRPEDVNFIKTLFTYDEVYIDGLLCTLKEYEDEDYNSKTTFTIAYQKDFNGDYIRLNINDVFSNIALQVVEFTPPDDSVFYDYNARALKIKFNQKIALTTNPTKNIYLYQNGSSPRIYNIYSIFMLVDNDTNLIIDATEFITKGDYWFKIDEGFITHPITGLPYIINDNTTWNFSVDPQMTIISAFVYDPINDYLGKTRLLFSNNGGNSPAGTNNNLIVEVFEPTTGWVQKTHTLVTSGIIDVDYIFQPSENKSPSDVKFRIRYDVNNGYPSDWSNEYTPAHPILSQSGLNELSFSMSDGSYIDGLIWAIIELPSGSYSQSQRNSPTYYNTSPSKKLAIRRLLNNGSLSTYYSNTIVTN